MGKFTGPDVVALSVPIAFASCLFFGMIGRAFVLDPDWSNGFDWYQKDQAKEYGLAYREQYKGMFNGRVTKKMWSLFNNETPPEK